MMFIVHHEQIGSIFGFLSNTDFEPQTKTWRGFPHQNDLPILRGIFFLLYSNILAEVGPNDGRLVSIDRVPGNCSHGPCQRFGVGGSSYDQWGRLGKGSFKGTIFSENQT